MFQWNSQNSNSFEDTANTAPPDRAHRQVVRRPPRMYRTHNRRMRFGPNQIDTDQMNRDYNPTNRLSERMSRPHTADMRRHRPIRRLFRAHRGHMSIVRLKIER